MLCSNTPMPAWVRVARPNKRRASRQHRPKVFHAGNLMQNAMTKFLDVCAHKMKKWRQLVIRSVWLQPGCANQANGLDLQAASHRLQRAQEQGDHILSIHLSFVPWNIWNTVQCDPACRDFVVDFWTFPSAGEGWAESCVQREALTAVLD